MILVDLSPVMISTLMVQIGFSKQRESTEVNEYYLRHLVLNTIRSYNKKYSPEYGQMVICCDSKSGETWRKQFFPYYKALRNQNRATMGLNWPEIFKTLNLLKEEIKNFLPYKTIEVAGCEADDIIATLAYRFRETEPVLILSSDKDFIQLQIDSQNVRQWSPSMGSFLNKKDAALHLKEHIIKGEPARTGDGIPNILSPDDVFVTGEGRKNVSKKKFEEWIKKSPEEIWENETIKRNWIRNETLVDFRKIPEEYTNEINKVFDECIPTIKKSGTLSYFMSKGLRNLINTIDEFY